MNAFAETAAEIAAVENPVDELRELIAESDRLLWVLEELNLDGRKQHLAGSGTWTADLSQRVLRKALPEEHEARLLVQNALDHVFNDIQPMLFRQHLEAIGFWYLAALDEPDEEAKS